MSLPPGTRLGAYEILTLLGSGGMGEVYRARDLKLGRDVAIKVLPQALGDDPERLARFEREAKTLAALDHSNIAHIHGFEDSTGEPALVMELVEGPTLADRIAKGPIPLDEALPIAKQIAEGLEAAHEQGIIHRDLKPANIKVREDGTVKILDFGLAKALEPKQPSGVNVTQSPTITTPAMTTGVGVVLGTAAYMSPEQARGKTSDKRADIWAFGVVLFEMLTSKRAFEGEDVTDTIVAVVSKDPDWQIVPATALPVRPLLERCLKKDLRQRLQAIGDARIEIEELIAGRVPGVTVSRADGVTRRFWPKVLAAIACGVAGGVLATWTMGTPQVRTPVSRFAIVPAPAQSLAMQGADRDVAISPDGHYIVYRADPGLAQLVVRAIDRIDAHSLGNISNARQPFFSPDGQWIGFFDGGGLKKVPTAGGTPVALVKNYMVPRGASWGDDNTIVFATNDTSSGLLQISASGGELTVLTRPDPTKGEKSHWRPSLLPGSRGILFTITPLNPADPPQVAVLDLKSGQRKTLIRGGNQPEYVSTGHLLYAAAGTLHAVRFDLKRLDVLGDPVPVVDDVAITVTAAVNYAVSQTGTLVYVPTSGAQKLRSLLWVDRAGQVTPIRAPSRMYAAPRVSPDGSRVALTIGDTERDIWVWDFVRQTLTRLTFDAVVDERPAWTPDGRSIVFASRRGGISGLFKQAADGSGGVERLMNVANGPAPSFVAADGTGIVGTVITPKTNGDIVWFPLKRQVNSSRSSVPPSAESVTEPEPLVGTPAIEINPEVSPDGHYIAYQSNESGREEIYVKPFPRVSDGRWQVSTEGGARPAWARNGRELFYVDLANTMTAVPVQTAVRTFSAGNPTKLFLTAYKGSLTATRDYDVAPDGRRFLMLQADAPRDRTTTPASMIVVQNWFEELKQRVPTK